ncbi:conserved hypothetical protein [Vibrio owensii]|uniref:Uncharacterized protein n=1 Tax=Vibrio owensii TaxID=696485 RepID=A0AAU9Q074_9VIBR|nr:conserved hypothetical protein [Vibrio owensii]CAH1532969.1 conserved hypothetical protein [Vibrio owensii]CAH1578891.1 conserved hypothetical protein [Vibrio owensii]CAH1598920.1 conserved hypothetical protein [Vibrio owensii]
MKTRIGHISFALNDIYIPVAESNQKNKRVAMQTITQKEEPRLTRQALK